MRHHSKRHSRKRGLLAKLGHKKVGVSFIFAGLLIASTATLLFWQHVDALTSKGWTFVGMASQYRTPAEHTHSATDERIIVNVYACKEAISGTTNKDRRYTVKAYATLVHNSITANYENPRLEILAKEGTLKRYSSGEPVDQPISRTISITAPFTKASFAGSTVLHYGFNNYYKDLSSGEASYAFGSVENLLSCQ